ncbi:hypothetical protein RF11_04244 [Thelohanellus kitauei]|uniref:FLYWCH-type domain-containing protein n=1 Tax=Thelohanellus kitauei TaxID=669202 RepID=A0A0C2MLK1_THEKT|nr:hypothetical protein RF11_04244 [Thelohanellus kitauei]
MGYADKQGIGLRSRENLRKWHSQQLDAIEAAINEKEQRFSLAAAIISKKFYLTGRADAHQRLHGKRWSGNKRLSCPYSSRFIADDIFNLFIQEILCLHEKANRRRVSGKLKVVDDGDIFEKMFGTWPVQLGQKGRSVRETVEDENEEINAEEEVGSFENDQSVGTKIRRVRMSSIATASSCKFSLKIFNFVIVFLGKLWGITANAKYPQLPLSKATSLGHHYWRCCKREQYVCRATLRTNGHRVVSQDLEHTNFGNGSQALTRTAIGQMKEQISKEIATPSSGQASLMVTLDDHVLVVLPKQSTLN